MFIIFSLMSITICLYLLNKRYYILALCKRVLTVNGEPITDCGAGIIKGDTIFGNNFDMLDLTPEKLFTKGRHYAETQKRNYFQYFLNSPVFNIIDAEYAELVLNNQNILSKGETYTLLQPFLGTGLLTSTDKKWHFRRKLLTPAFHFNILQRFLETFKEEVVKFLNGLEKPSEKNEIINLNEIIPKFTLNNICETALGINLDDINKSAEYRHNIHKSEELYLKRVCNPILYFDSIYKWKQDSKDYLKIVQQLHEFSSNIITNRRRQYKKKQHNEKLLNRGDDTHPDNDSLYFKKERHAMLDTLLAAEKQNLIDHNGICEEVDTFMFEGFDTTSISLMFTMLMLSLHQDVQQKCYDEIENLHDDLANITIQNCSNYKYLDCVIKETLRLFPPVPFISRHCPDEIIIGEFVLPEGTNINLHIFDIHRDPKHYPHPERFDPERFLPQNSINRHPFAFIPFSAGPRNCIGQKFAMLEVKLLLINVIKNYQLFAVTKVQDIVFESGMVLRSKYPIEIKIKSRHS